MSSTPAAHSSPLFRAHTPALLDLSWWSDVTDEQFAQLASRAESFSRITRLRIDTFSERLWSESQLMSLLSKPCMQRVSEVHVRSSVWLRTKAAQLALFSLPALTSLILRLDYKFRRTDCLLKSAVQLAAQLTTVRCQLHADAHRFLRGLWFAPVLASLKLEGMDWDPLGPLIWNVPPAICELVVQFALDASRSALKTLFSRLRQLRLLRTECLDIVPVLQGMLDAGAPALPLLARVVFRDGCVAGLTVDLLRRFLHRFPLVTVRFESSIPRHNDSSLAAMFAGWPRVEFQRPLAMLRRRLCRIPQTTSRNRKLHCLRIPMQERTRRSDGRIKCCSREAQRDLWPWSSKPRRFAH